ncbi:MAG: hypothetical protein LUD46_12610 [Parabacteroides sp.]|nr:hypothetical protein [Parabacteroides sp.]
MTNRFGASYSDDLIHWSVEEDVSFPSEARHGCVSVITSEEAKKLMEAYPVAGPKTLISYVNPLYGSTTLWDSIDLGYKPSPHPEFRTVLTEQGRRPAQGYTRAWGGETFPGSTLPHAMVQATPPRYYVGKRLRLSVRRHDYPCFFPFQQRTMGVGTCAHYAFYRGNNRR